MKGYRTITFNAVAAVTIMFAEVLIEVGYSPELQYFLGEEGTPYLMLALLFANVVLRVLTTTPIGDSE